MFEPDDMSRGNPRGLLLRTEERRRSTRHLPRAETERRAGPGRVLLLWAVAGLAVAGSAARSTGQSHIPHFLQCDSRWGSDVIGTRANVSDDSTICRVGCAMTSLAMLLAGLNVPVATVRPLAGSLDPGSLNTWLRWNGRLRLRRRAPR